MPQLIHPGRMMNRGPGWGQGGYSIVSPEARAWIDDLSTKPPASMWPAIDTFFQTATGRTYWAKIRFGALPVFEYNAANANVVNIKSPGTGDGTLAGGYTLTPGVSVQGNGTSGRLETTFSNAGFQNDAGIGLWSISSGQVASEAVAGNNNTSMVLRNTSNVYAGRINAATNRTSTVTDASGWFAEYRSGAASTTDLAYRNQTALTMASGGTSGVPDTDPIWFMARNSDTPIYSARAFLCFFVTQNLISTENNELQGDLYTLFLATGVIQETTITSFAADKFFAPGSNIAIAGSYYGDAADIEIRVLNSNTQSVVVDWASIAVGPSGGTWSGNLTAPAAGGPYTVQTRKAASSAPFGTTASTFFVGPVLLGAGQSNLRNMMSASKRTPLTADSLTRRYENGAAWNLPSLTAQTSEPSTNWGATGYGGDGMVALLNLIQDASGDPVAMLNLAIGGVTSTTWAPPAGSSWTSAQGAITGSTQDPGWPAISGVIIHQGEGYSGTWATDWQAFIDEARTLSGNANLPVFVVLIGPHTVDGNAADRDAERQAMLTFIDDNTSGNIHYGGTATDCTLEDEVHYVTASYSQKLAPRIAQAWNFVQGDAAYGCDGPKIAGATVAIGANQMVVSVTQDQGTTLWDASNNPAGTGLTNCEVEVDSSSRTITASALVNGTIVLTFNGAAAVSAARFRYLYGDCYPNTNPVYDNVVVPGSTLGLPLQPSRGWLNAVVS